MLNLGRLQDFVQSFTRLVDVSGDDESRVVEEGQRLLADLIRHDDWLPDEFATSADDGYVQNLLHCDPMQRFSVLCVVLGPGQETPVHDHGVWGMVGVMRGVERCVEYAKVPGKSALAVDNQHELKPGQIDLVSPRIGDIHKVCNNVDGCSVSIHVYGTNIGKVRRHVYDVETGERQAFISGYTKDVVPNVWSQSTMAE